MRAGRAAPKDFPRAKPEGNREEKPCQPEENFVLPDSFTQIYIIFLFSVLALLKCTDGSVLAFLKSRDGSILALLKSTDGSV